MINSINCVVTFSNIFGLGLILKAFEKNMFTGFLMLFIVLSSVFMHISETKHNLPGILFVQYSNILLNIDRFASIVGVIYCIIKILYNPTDSSLLTIDIIAFGLFGLFGLLMNYCSEIVFKNNQILFAITHIIWHYIAYSTLYYFV